MATATLRALRTPAPEAASANGDADLKVVMRELGAVANYIAHIKQEIGALRANELYRDRIPTAHDELGSVVKATATHTIMSAAEDILGSNDTSLEAYRSQVEAKVLEIFEACSFQDITGQRISKVVEALAQVEKRLSRFASAVDVRDDAFALANSDEALRQARREVLILNGPPAEGRGVQQDEIDALFA
jgi:chemotaxis protein CheZ